jgi:hypothetical protein
MYLRRWYHGGRTTSLAFAAIYLVALVERSVRSIKNVLSCIGVARHTFVQQVNGSLSQTCIRTRFYSFGMRWLFEDNIPLPMFYYDLAVYFEVGHGVAAS